MKIKETTGMHKTLSSRAVEGAFFQARFRWHITVNRGQDGNLINIPGAAEQTAGHNRCIEKAALPCVPSRGS